MSQTISIRIDGEYIKGTEGQSILEAAWASGHAIPALCYMKGLSAVGACRLCMVEVAGVNRLLPACTTPAEDGMSVTTDSQRLKKLRGKLLRRQVNRRKSLGISPCLRADCLQEMRLAHARGAINQ